MGLDSANLQTQWEYSSATTTLLFVQCWRRVSGLGQECLRTNYFQHSSSFQLHESMLIGFHHDSMQINRPKHWIEVQYLHTSLQISFALSEYDSSVLVLCQQIIKFLQYISDFLSSYFWYFIFMRCSAVAVLCLQIFCSEVQCVDRTLALQCSKSVPTTSLP